MKASDLAAAPLCETCGEIVPPWRRAWSRCCDGCDRLSPRRDDDLSPVIVPHIVTAPVELPKDEEQ